MIINIWKIFLNKTVASCSQVHLGNAKVQNERYKDKLRKEIIDLMSCSQVRLGNTIMNYEKSL